MEFFKRLEFSFLSVVMLIVLPFIIAAIVGMAILNYHESYNSILEGFKKKLLAVSSVSASFIDGDDHKIVARAKEMKAFTKLGDKLYAVSKENKLQTIHLVKGAAIQLKGFKKLGLINDLSSKDESLYAVTKSKELIHLNLNTKNIKIIKHFDFDLTALAINEKFFYIASNTELYLYTNDKVKLLKEYKHKIENLSFEKGFLYGINEEEGQVFSINVNTLVLKHLKLKNLKTDVSSFKHIAMDTKNFYFGDKQLLVYERNSSKLIYEDFAKLYRDETASVYKKYHVPMTKIKLALNLTYHYTFNLLYEEEDNCFYIFDVNEGGEYNPIGSYDEMDRDDLLGAESVMLRDESYVGEIKNWEKWGLLKVAYAGILDKNSHVSAIVGTDVDITIIKEKTKEALMKSVLIGIIAMFITILAAYFVARKIIMPIETLKFTALKIAAGKYGEEIEINSAKELNELSYAFNLMSEELEKTVGNFYSNTKEIENKNIIKELRKRLSEYTSFEDDDYKMNFLSETPKARGVLLEGNVYYIYEAKDSMESEIEGLRQGLIYTELLKALFKSQDATKEFISLVRLKSFISFSKDGFYDLIEMKVLSKNNLEKIQIEILHKRSGS